MKKTFRVFSALQKAHQAVFSAADRTLKEREGILTAHQAILFVLYKEDGLPSSDIATRIGISKSRLTGLIDTLECKELIRRERGKKDSRQRIVFIKPKGRAVVDRTKGWTNQLNKRLLNDFNNDERLVIERFLQNIASKADSILDI